ncbi:MAG: DUF2325 domain-containing protein [Clostridia bacterium]|nr:DUF2325 domain-containing protein [Clostridia bacterium]
MSVVIVGGHDRMECRYKEICKRYGFKCKVFTQYPADFKNKIGRPDVMIIFTQTVAHKMVNIASEQAKKANVTVKHIHSSSACALCDILSECAGMVG